MTRRLLAGMVPVACPLAPGQDRRLPPWGMASARITPGALALYVAVLLSCAGGVW